jgi:hypothetical protein
LVGPEPGGEQRDVPAGEIEMLDVLDLELLAGLAELDLGALRTRRGNGGDLVDRKRTLGKDVEHLAAHVPRRADNYNPVTHVTSLQCRASHDAGRP